MNIPTELKYLESHEWIRIEGNIGTVGITEHAQSDVARFGFNADSAQGRGDPGGGV